MYYLSAILLLLFKIPPKREHFKRLGASLAKRGQMRLYERIIDAYDKNMMLYTQKNAVDISFTGSGFNTGVMNAYRKIELKQQTLFEKIYFKERKQNVLFFRNVLQPELLKQGINIAKLVKLSEGEHLFIAYYEYFDLEPLDPDDYLEKATDIAARIVHIKFDSTIKFPKNRYTYKTGDFQTAFENLKEELSSGIPGIDSLLDEANNYIKRKATRSLNHSDLSDKNAFKNEKVIDWDNFGFYPVGYDFGLIIGLASQQELTLKKYLEIEEKIYDKISDIVSREEFQISLPYFTSVFIRSYRVRSRYNNEHRNKQAAYELASLLKDRFKKIR